MKFATFSLLVIFGFAACGSPQNPVDQQQDTVSGQHKSSQVTLPFPSGNVPIDTTNYPELRSKVRSLARNIQSSSLSEKKTVQQIPRYILAYMDSAFNGFTIANANEEWQVGCVVVGKSITEKVYDEKTGDTTLLTHYDRSQPLPSYQFIYYGMNNNMAVLAYRSGGWGVCGHLAIFELENSTVIGSWIQYAPDTLNSKQDIITFLNTPQDGNMLLSSRLDTH